MRRLLFAEFPHDGFPPHQRQIVRPFDRAIFVFAGENVLVAIWHSENPALLNRQQRALFHHGISARIRSDLCQLVLRGELFLQRGRLSPRRRNRHGKKYNPRDHSAEFLWHRKSSSSVLQSIERMKRSEISAESKQGERKTACLNTTEGSAGFRRSLVDVELRTNQLLRTTPARVRSLLLNLRLGLISLLLLILESLRHGRIRWRRRHSPSLSPGIRRRRHTVRPLFLRQFAHAVGDVLLEVVVHLLQIIHFHGNGLSRRAITFFGRRNAGRHCLVSIRCVRKAGNHITRRQRTFLTVGHHRYIGIHHKRALCWIQRRGRSIAARSRSRCWSGRRLSARILAGLRLLRSELGFHLLSK